MKHANEKTFSVSQTEDEIRTIYNQFLSLPATSPYTEQYRIMRKLQPVIDHFEKRRHTLESLAAEKQAEINKINERQKRKRAEILRQIEEKKGG